MEERGIASAVRINPVDSRPSLRCAHS